MEDEPPRRVKSNMKPRDALDAVVCSVTGIVLIAVLTAGPGLVVWALSSSVALSVVAGVGFYGLFLAHIVSELEITDRGVRFIRKLGSPREISWAELERVEEATARELILWGWFLPPFPAREMSTSFSIYGHVAFRWKGRSVYFPPKDPAAFLKMANERLRAARRSQSSDADEPGLSP